MNGSPWKWYFIVLSLALFAAYLWWPTASHPPEKTEQMSSEAKPSDPPPKPDPTRYNVPRAPDSQSKAAPSPQSAMSSSESRALAIGAFQYPNRKRSDKVASPRFERLPRGAAQQLNGKWLQVVRARAVADGNYDPAMGEVLATKQGFKVVALDVSESDRSWQDLTLKKDEWPVLINSSNGQVAIASGTVIVTLKNLADAAAIASQERLEIVATDDAISTVYLRAPPGYALLSGLQRIQSDVQRVERARLELHQSMKVPR